MWWETGLHGLLYTVSAVKVLMDRWLNFVGGHWQIDWSYYIFLCLSAVLVAIEPTLPYA